MKEERGGRKGEGRKKEGRKKERKEEREKILKETDSQTRETEVSVGDRKDMTEIHL